MNSAGGSGLTSGGGLGGGGLGGRSGSGLSGRSGLSGSGLGGLSGVPREFLDRPALTVAPALIGCVLAHETDDGLVAVEIAEVEAYCGESDPASHAFRGKTVRNAVMYGEPGHAYVYFTYGMHFCVNLVCLPAGEAAAVLLRAGRVVEGAGLAAARRLAGRRGTTGASGGGPVGGASRGGAASVGGRVVGERELASGPARLCQALAIDRTQNGADVCDPGSPLRLLAAAGFAGLPAASIGRGPRVGVRLGAEADWRFWAVGEPAVSAYRPYAPRRRAAAGPAG